METTVTIERLTNEEVEDLPSHEILRENLTRKPNRKAARKAYKKHKCKICYEEFEDRSSLQQHATTHDPDYPYPCTQCGYKTHIRKYLSRHVRKVHNKANYKLECDVCGKKFLFQCLLDKHVRVHTGEKPNKCEVCGKAFNSTYSLNVHKLIHTDEKPYKCSFCDHACRDGSSLRKHQNVHLGIAKKYPCLECPYKFETKARLLEHTNVKHLGIEPPPQTCPQCNKLFKTKWTLLSHIKCMHEKSLTCICGICGRSLSNRANLRQHMVSHLDTRPYKCTYSGCEGRYKDYSALKKHARIHDPSQQMFCDKCGKGFTRKERLAAHLMKQHAPKVKDKKCPFCGVCFYNKNYLLKHMRTNHLQRKRYMCDMCNFETTNKPSIVMHIKYGHGEKTHNACRLCEKTFRMKYNLKDHYRNAHNIRYKTKVKQQPMVVIKQEPSELVPDLEFDLLDIDKEEPFAGFDVDQNGQRERKLSIEISGHSNNYVDYSIAGSHKQEDTENVDSVKLNEDTVYHTTEESEAERTAIPVEEFLEKVLSDTEITETEVDREKEAYMKMRIEELIEISNQKNGIHKKRSAIGRRLERVDVNEISKFLFTNINIEVANGEVITHKKENDNIPKPKRKKKKRAKRREYDKSVYRKKDKKSAHERDAKKYDRKSKSKIASYEEDSNNEILEIYETKTRDKTLPEEIEKDGAIKDETDGVIVNRESERDGVIVKKQTAAEKITSNMHQCYVCFKVYPTKPQLIEHCKQHFDVCNEVTLKKCPLCPYVSHNNIKRHMKLKHNENIQFSFIKIIDKKVSDTGSRYYFETDNERIKQLEIIPSIKILNKIASMDLDKKNREMKDKTVLKRKLVKKGKEWIVETEKIDISNSVVPKLKDKCNYLASLKKLSIESKKKGEKMLYPCNVCSKICQNLSALTLHLRKHDPNAKPFKPKVWKHKTKVLPVQKEKVPKTPNSNRTAKPRPIRNNHKCDPKLKDFYENNIKGGDIEFWQFLKIYNKMDRENVNDFKDLESRSDFGLVNVKLANSNANEEESTKDSSRDHVGTSNTEKSSVEETTKNCGSIFVGAGNTENSSFVETTKDCGSKNVVGAGSTVKSDVKSNRNLIKKIKYVRRIRLSRDEYRIRCQAKNKLREKLLKTS